MPRPASTATRTTSLVTIDGGDGRTPYSYQRIFLDDGSTSLRLRDETAAIVRAEDAMGVNLAVAGSAIEALTSYDYGVLTQAAMDADAPHPLELPAAPSRAGTPDALPQATGRLPAVNSINTILPDGAWGPEAAHGMTAHAPPRASGRTDPRRWLHGPRTGRHHRLRRDAGAAAGP